MDYRIYTNHKLHRDVVLKVLFAKGFNYAGCTTVEAVDKEFKYYPHILYRGGSFTLHGNINSDLPQISLEELLMKLEKSVTVKLNNSHLAVVTPEGIQVGCQTFPLTIVDELAAAVKQVQEN